MHGIGMQIMALSLRRWCGRRWSYCDDAGRSARTGCIAWPCLFQMSWCAARLRHSCRL